MRKLHLADALQPVAVADGVARRDPLATTVERHHRRVFERRGQKRADLVRQVMINEVPAIVHAVLPAKACAQVMRSAVGRFACLRRVKLSSSAAAMTRPSSTRQAEESWKAALIPSVYMVKLQPARAAALAPNMRAARGSPRPPLAAQRGRDNRDVPP